MLESDPVLPHSSFALKDSYDKMSCFIVLIYKLARLKARDVFAYGYIPVCISASLTLRRHGGVNYCLYSRGA